MAASASVSIFTNHWSLKNGSMGVFERSLCISGIVRSSTFSKWPR